MPNAHTENGARAQGPAKSPAEPINEKAYSKHLVAILHADVAGYSRLTAEAEEQTHRLLSTYLDLIAEYIASGSGELMKFAGDAVTASFSSAAEALTCAEHIQRELRQRNQTLPPQRQINFRIGINVGDVIRDRNDIYGNGVNVAARLETLAEPGGVCISESAHSAIGTKLPMQYEYMGAKRVKNIDRPLRVYRVHFGDAPAVNHRRRRLIKIGVAAGLAVLALVIGALYQLGGIPGHGGETGLPSAPFLDIGRLSALTTASTEKGTYMEEGEWLWFAEYFDKNQTLHGVWGLPGEQRSSSSYPGRWRHRARSDGVAEHCTIYMDQASLHERCFSYHPLAGAQDSVDGIHARFSKGRCVGVSYFEPGNTTDKPIDRSMPKLLELSRRCQR